MNLQENIHRIKEMMGIINESSYEEGWELVGQEHPVISSLVKSLGYEYDEDSVQKIVPILDKLPEQEFDYNQIKNFHNLENDIHQKGLVKKMKKISKTKNPRQGYEDFMNKRDNDEGRNRGYEPVKNYDRIVNANYEPPVVLEVDGEYYVIGGRTRIYASIAADTPIKIKVLTKSDL